MNERTVEFDDTTGSGIPVEQTEVSSETAIDGGNVGLVDGGPGDGSEGASDADPFAVELPPVSDSVMESDNVDGLDTGPESESEIDPESWRGRLSRSGERYDPEIHTWPPKETKAGNWRKRRGRQKVGEVETSTLMQQAELAAFAYAQLHPLFLGPEAGLRDPADIVPLRDALVRYIESQGLTELPPEIEVVLAAGGYTVHVVARPPVWERVRDYVSRAFGWVREKMRNGEE